MGEEGGKSRVAQGAPPVSSTEQERERGSSSEVGLP